MDLGIKGRSAIVGGASKGLGKGCALALAREGVDVTIVARGREALEATAAEIRAATGVKVTPVAANIDTAEGRAAVFAACPAPDILVNNSGGPPAGAFKDWGREDWIKALDANMLSPIEMIKTGIDGMVKRGYGRVINITSTSVKAPIAVLGLSNGARAGLTGFVAGIARDYVKHGVTINNLLPGPFDTDRLRSINAAGAKKSGVSVEEFSDARRKQNPAGRFGTPEEFGAMCAFLCGRLSGFISGQNIVIDGGQYPGTF